MRDIALSIVGAALAWGAYELLGHPGWALAVLAVYTAVLVWLKRRDPQGDDG